MTTTQGAEPVDLLRARLSTALREAIRTRDGVATRTLRSLLGALDNATAVAETSAHVEVWGRSGDVPRRVVTIDEAEAILRLEASERAAAALDCDRHQRPADAERLRAELAVVRRYIDT